ncbi:MAG: type II restriction endonuclease [Candidatus Heimdallarchaeota archaeon]
MFDFAKELKSHLQREFITDRKDWSIKGFIDAKKKIYPISLDTKLLSKILELTILPLLIDFCKKHELEYYLAESQIQYPDVTLEGKLLGMKKYALDIKTTYRTGTEKNIRRGFTLGSFRGCLRDIRSTRYSRFPYAEYKKHWILGIIYSRREGNDVKSVYDLNELPTIKSVITDLEIILQEKYKIANFLPGSGNTANIGSITNLEKLRNGTGPFSEYGREVFEHYWRNYLRNEDAERMGIKRSYRNLEEYFTWKEKQEKRKK